MNENHNLQEMVDVDVAHCEEVWKEYSHDKDKLEELFQTMLARYGGKIDGLTEDMLVISLFEESARMAETYRENMKRLLSRLRFFRDNGYTNDGLQEFCLKQEHQELWQCNLNFSEVRMLVGMMHDVPHFEKEEIMNKVGEIEEICAKPISKFKKWEMLRPYIVWISGKDVAVAMKILPLFFNVEL